ncbi:hypothetical protein MAUB1S_08305 [Mycolicibacterium aubagnense]
MPAAEWMRLSCGAVAEAVVSLLICRQALLVKPGIRKFRDAMIRSQERAPAEADAR